MPISYEDFRRLPEPDQFKNEVLASLERMKQPENLLEGCAKYVAEEKREGVYVVVLEYVERHGQSSQVVVLAAQTLLLAWNTPLYCKKMSRLQKVGPDLKRLFEANAATLDKVRSKTLGQLSGEDFVKVRDLFHSFGSCDSIYWTGASKALHVANPGLFVMWDRDIRTMYHMLHDSHDPSTCYAEFMRSCNDIAKSLAACTTESELSLRHPGFEIMQFRRTLAKMIDEYNYAVIKPIAKRAKASTALSQAS